MRKCNCSYYFLILMNVILLLSGIGIIIIGGYFYSLTKCWFWATIIPCVYGILVVFISVMGYFVKNNRCLVGFY